MAGATLVPLLLIVALEMVLRIGGYGYPTDFFLPWKIDDRAVLVENGDFGRRFFPRRMVRRPVPLVVEKNKPSDAYRVFVFGESAAMGDPDPSFSFSRILRVLLGERFPGTEFEMVNTAFTAINSHVILPIVRESAHHEGNLWIIYMGNNEVAGPFGPATVFGSQPKSPSLIRAGIAVKSLKLGQFIESQRERLAGTAVANQEWGGLQMFLQNQISADDSRLKMVYESFERNLADILKAGARSGVDIVLSTVASNLKDCPPFASVHGTNLSEKNRIEWERNVSNGIDHEAARRFGEALAAYSAAAKLDSDHAALQFRIGQCQLALGDKAAARKAFELARDLDALRFRTDTRMNEIIRAAAATAQSIHLADAAQTLGAANGEIPGNESFFDHVHLTFSGNYGLALSIAEEALAVLPEAILQRDTNRWPSEDDCARQLALTAWNRVQLLNAMRQRLSEAPFTNQLNHAVRQQRFREQIEALQPMLQAGSLDRAEETYRQALTAFPNDFSLHQNFASFLYARNDIDAAIPQAEDAVRLLPHHPSVHYNLGFFLNAAGKSAEAEKHFQQALFLNPDYSDAYSGLGKAKTLQENFADAIEAFSKALIHKPKSPDVLLSLSQLWQKEGNREKAGEFVKKALKVQPESYAIQMQMGDILLEEGDLLTATRHYGEAARIDPDSALNYFAAQTRAQPDSARAHFFLANAMAARNERAGSIELLKKAIELDPDFWEARYLFGVELATQAKVQLAQAQFVEVVRLKPDFALGHLNLGVAYAQTRQWSRARAEFQEVLKLDPGNEQARQYVGMIDTMQR